MLTTLFSPSPRFFAILPLKQRESERHAVNGTLYYLVGVLWCLSLYPRGAFLFSTRLPSRFEADCSLPFSHSPSIPVSPYYLPYTHTAISPSLSSHPPAQLFVSQPLSPPLLFACIPTIFRPLPRRPIPSTSIRHRRPLRNPALPLRHLRLNLRPSLRSLHPPSPLRRFPLRRQKVSRGYPRGGVDGHGGVVCVLEQVCTRRG